MVRLIRILIVGFVLWLLCGAMPEPSVSCNLPAAELSAANSYTDQLRCERICNSDLNLTRGIVEIASQTLVRTTIRPVDLAVRPVLKFGAGCSCDRGTVCAPGTSGSEGVFVCGQAVDYYVYRLRRLII